MNSRSTAGRLTIDLDAIASNWRTLTARAAGADVAAMVKADGYGLGAVPAARHLAAAGCREFFVAELGEASELRGALPEADIFVLSGATPGSEHDLVEMGLVPVLISFEQVRRWATHASKTGARRRASLHLDTGMNRTGLDRSDTAMLLADLSILDGLDIVHVMSHLASSDEPDNPQNDAQLAAFHQLHAAVARGAASLANSAGIGLGRRFHLDHVRPGVALYGADPTPTRSLALQPVVELTAPVIQTRQTDEIGSVGYGGTHQLEGSRRLATIAAGYGDGYSRRASNRGQVAFDGHPAPIVGRVSMDLITVDITDLPDSIRVEPGTEAELIGPTITVDDVAEAAETIAYEVLTNLGRRYARHYITTGPRAE